MIAILLFLPLVLDETAAQARLELIRAQFTQLPKAQSVAALVALGDEAPDTQAGGRALAWLGDMAHLQKQDGVAEGFYRRAYQSHAGGEAHRLGARGLGDVEMSRNDFRDAIAHYREAVVGATGVMSTELMVKIELGHKLRRRQLGEWACTTLLLLVLAGFLLRSRFWRAPALGVPTELLYVVPLYGLILLGCWGRDPGVMHALWILALGSTALVGAAGLSARRAPPLGWRRWLHAGILVAANLALFYVACNRAMIVDSLFFTVAPD